MKYIITILTIITNIGFLSAQILTADKAGEISLANNYDILIAENQTQQALNNTGIYNSRMLPTASATGGGKYNLSGGKVERQDGSELSTSNIASSGLNAGIGVNYVIYAGKSRLYNIQRFREVYQLSSLQARSVMERTLMQVYSQYYQIAQLRQNTNNIAATLAISKHRLTRAEYGYEYGQSNKLDVLNAKVDINNDSISYVNIQQQLQNAKRSLNLLLGRDVDEVFDIDTTVRFAEGLQLDELLQSGAANNVALLAAQKNIDLNDLDIKINKTRKLPTVSLSGNYGWNYLNNGPTSLFAKQNSLGLQLGLNATWTLFDGGRTRLNEQNLIVAHKIYSTQKYQQEQSLETNIKNAWQTYQNALFVLNAQAQNIATSQQNFDYTNDKFEAGQVSSILFRQAQLNLLFTKNAYHQAKYNAKLAELNLLWLSGQLLK